MRQRTFRVLPLAVVLGVACESLSGTGRSKNTVYTMLPPAPSAQPAAAPAPGQAGEQGPRRLAADGVSLEIPLDDLYDRRTVTTLTVGPGARIAVEPSGEFRRPVTVHLSKAMFSFGPDAFVALIDGESSHSLGPLRQDADSYYFETMGFSNLEVIDHYRGTAEPGSWYAGQSSGFEQDLEWSRVESTYFNCFTDVGSILGSIAGLHQPRCVDSGACYQLLRGNAEARLVSPEIASRLYTLRDLVHSTFGLDWEIALNGAWDSSGLRYRSKTSPHYHGSAVDLAVCRRVGPACETDPSKFPQLAPLVASAFAGASLSGGNPGHYVSYQSFYKEGSVGDHVHASVDSPSVASCVQRGTCGLCLPSQVCDQASTPPVCRERCEFNSDCSSNCCIQTNTGGFCAEAERCGTPESPCGSCRAGEACLSIGGNPTGCGSRCNSNAECPGGCCVRTGVNGICASAASCAAADTCGICDSSSTCVNTDDGQSCLTNCQSDSQCGSGNCAALVSGNGSVCSPTLRRDACGGCPGGQSCVNWNDGKGSRCAAGCESADQCESGCCASPDEDAPDGPKFCAPGKGACNPCPAGQYPLIENGPCSDDPTGGGCDNGEIVCSCPETHGIWCHPSCEFGTCNGVGVCTPTR
jgi:hypothetical protein